MVAEKEYSSSGVVVSCGGRERTLSDLQRSENQKDSGGREETPCCLL